MKKLLIVIVSALLLLTGCSAASRVDTMKGWTFQYNEGTNDYSLFFGLCNSRNKYVSAPATVEIKIVNDNDEVVYEGIKEITKNDFGTYTSQVAGERYLADVRISRDEIAEGSSDSGKVYFTVSNPSEFCFDEVNCNALFCLPIKGVEVEVGELPLELEQKDLWGNIISRVSITNVSYKFDSGYGSPTLHFVISGEKTYESSNSVGYDIISYKLYDSEGYLANSGQVYLGTSLNKGDKFKDDSLAIYDITPGEFYTLQLMNYEY